jgi:hypothetical protein
MEYPYDTSCKDYDQNLGHIKKTGNFFIPLNRIVSKEISFSYFALKKFEFNLFVKAMH